MQPNLTAPLAAAHRDDLQRAAARARLTRRARRAAAHPALDVVIRAATANDKAAIAALAELDEAPVPAGDVLVAEVGGRPLAVLPLCGGRSFADPFAATGDLVELLEMRAAQLVERCRERRRWLQAPALLRRIA